MQLPENRFPKLDLHRPDFEYEIRNQNYYIKDVLRKQQLLLTPEEWVRQHVLHWLLSESAFPASLLSIERQVAKTGKRADVIGYGRDGDPLLLVECKAPLENINQETARQALVYNRDLGCRYVWLTNGLIHRVLQIEGMEAIQLDRLPDFGF